MKYCRFLSALPVDYGWQINIRSWLGLFFHFNMKLLPAAFFVYQWFGERLQLAKEDLRLTKKKTFGLIALAYDMCECVQHSVWPYTKPGCIKGASKSIFGWLTVYQSLFRMLPVSFVSGPQKAMVQDAPICQRHNSAHSSSCFVLMYWRHTHDVHNDRQIIGPEKACKLPL